MASPEKKTAERFEGEENLRILTVFPPITCTRGMHVSFFVRGMRTHSMYIQYMHAAATKNMKSHLKTDTFSKPPQSKVAIF